MRQTPNYTILAPFSLRLAIIVDVIECYEDIEKGFSNFDGSWRLGLSRGGRNVREVFPGERYLT